MTQHEEAGAPDELFHARSLAVFHWDGEPEMPALVSLLYFEESLLHVGRNMKSFGCGRFAVVLLIVSSIHTVATSELPDLKELREILRANLPGVTEADLDQAAVEGLLAKYRARVALAGTEGDSGSASNTAAITKATVLEGEVAYVRVRHVVPALADDLLNTVQQLGATNRLKGLVMDLRFTGGQDFSGASASADLFLSTARPLLDWGEGMKESKAKANAIAMPVALLVNAETAGAAEALAAVMRESGAVLILGATTAGYAHVMKSFPLANGQSLRVAIAGVRLGDGSLLSEKGLSPDIEVAVKPEEERAYFEDAFAVWPRTNRPAVAGSTSTNSPAGTNRVTRRPRPNEADLVRARRDGLTLNADALAARDTQPEKPVIRDPALARAVDVLKGLAVVRRPRS